MDFASARKAERISGGPTTFRRANQTDKQTMAALYAAEQGLPQNLTDPEVRRRFIDQHRVKPPEVATPTKQATPSVPRRVSTQSAMSPILGAVAAASGAGAMGTAFNLATDVSGLLTLPPPKDRMEGEKAWNTDTGLAFDWIDGELVASPEGFKAVRQREKEGRSWPGPYAAR
jgi:hypothetical protein